MMGTKTTVSWTNHTFNPWHGCKKKSPGCAHCYAEAFSKRTGHDFSKHRFFEKPAHWQEPYLWNDAAQKAGVPSKVFCGSMCDWAEDSDDLKETRAGLWQVIRSTPWLVWQLLTKRAECIRDFLPTDWGTGYPNVWLGVSVENMEYAYRIYRLAMVPAVVRFVSYEPALGPIAGVGLMRIHWLICGGESGGKRRPFVLQWARDIQAQCRRERVAFFFKQRGGLRPGTEPHIDGVQYHEFPEIKTP